MVHGQADDTVGHLVGLRQVLACGTGQTAIGAEVGDERIEVAAAKDVLRLHLEIEFVTGHAILLGINEDGEVGVVVTHTGHIVPEGDARDGTQGFAVLDGNLMACFDGGIDLLEVQEAVCAAHLIHLGVDAWGYDGGLSGKAEVLQVVDAFLRDFVMHNHGTALDGVIHLGRVETEGGHITGIEDALAIDLHTEGMGGVIDDLQSVFVCNLLDFLGLTGLAIAVDGHDSRGLRRDGGLDTCRIDITRGGVDVHEDGTAAVPPDAVGGGHEAVGRGDDLARDAQGLQGGEQGQCAVGEEADVGYLQVLCQCSLQFLVEAAVVGNPFGIPHLFQEFMELIEVRKQWGCDGNKFIVHIVIFTILYLRINQNHLSLFLNLFNQASISSSGISHTNCVKEFMNCCHSS